MAYQVYNKLYSSFNTLYKQIIFYNNACIRMYNDIMYKLMGLLSYIDTDNR